MPGTPDFHVPPVVLGCGNFGGIGSSPDFFERGETEEQALALMDAAWTLGLDWFDTADAYGGGRSETWIGRWLVATGNRPRITTKTFNPMDRGEDRGLARDRILRQIETSLARLGVDRVELYLAHEPDPDTPVAETVGAFEELATQGVIGAWGVSNYDGAGLREVLRHGTPALIQNAYSLLERADDAVTIPLCREHGVVYQAFSPLAGGWLTGKYRRDASAPEGSRMTLRPEPYLHLRDDRVFDGLEALEREAQTRGVSMAGLALAWVVGEGVSAVVGPRRPAQLDPVEEARRVDLGSDERAALGSVFR